MSNTFIIGNAVRDPELRYTPSGSAMASFGVAENRKWRNAQGEQQEQTSFFDVVCWRDLAENVADSINKGDRVIVVGRLEQRSWETNSGDKRSKVEIVADAVGPDLRWARAQVAKADRNGATTSSAPAGQDDYSADPF